jgi:iron(III) transport system substrate-binding protein
MHASQEEGLMSHSVTRHRRAIVAAIGAVAIAVLLAFAGSVRAAGAPLRINGETIANAALNEAAKREGTLNAYFSYPQAIIQRIVAQFTEDTGIKVNLTRLASDQLAERIRTEAGAGVLQADVISLTEMAAVQDLINRKIITKYKVPNFNAIPANLKSPQGYWYAEARPVYGFAYNKALLKDKDVPRTWEGLLQPEFKGRIGILNAYTGGSGWTVAMFLREKFGIDYWRRLAAQQPFLATGVGQLTDALIRGQIAISINHFGTVLAQAERGAPLGFYFPKGGAPTVMEALSLATNAPHPNAAKLYLHWALSRRGAQVIAKETGEYTAFPTARGASAPEVRRAAPWVPTLKDYLRLRKSWIEEWARIFNYTQTS